MLYIFVSGRWMSLGSWNCWLRTPFYEGETNVVVEDAAVGEDLATNEVDWLISGKSCWSTAAHCI